MTLSTRLRVILPTLSFFPSPVAGHAPVYNSTNFFSLRVNQKKCSSSAFFTYTIIMSFSLNKQLIVEHTLGWLH